MDDFMVTIKLRVTVTDSQSLLQAWQARYPAMAETVSADPEVSLTLAVQDAFKPPDLSTVTGLTFHQSRGTVASVKAEPWRDEPGPW